MKRAQEPAGDGWRMRRTCVVELIVDEEAERRLRQLCELSSKLWDEVNYARLRMFLERKYVDFKGTYKEFYEKYRPVIGSATVQQVLNRNNDIWRGFFRLLRLKKKGKLSPSITGASPPGSKKRNKPRMLWAVLRKDQYKIDSDRIILMGLGAIGWIEVGYKGLIRLRSERGELRICYDVDRGNGMPTYRSRSPRRLLGKDGNRCRNSRRVI